MKNFRWFLLYFLFLLLILAALPLVLVSGDNRTETPIQEGTADSSPVIKIENATGSIYEDTLEHFLMGVVAAEMPRSFPQEALKAQAIAARTYIYGQIGKGLYDGADTCIDPNRAQAWVNIDTALPATADNQKNDWQKIIEAVETTRGLIITYNGAVASTFYCSTCGGQTASAKEVWGSERPWLKSVTCPYDQDAPKYQTQAVFSRKELAKLLGVTKNEIGKIKVTSRTKSGRVAQLSIGKKAFTGSEIREKLNLNSTNFSIAITDDTVVFQVCGYGHGVGLCQYGAKGLAEHGMNYKQILTHYYTGVKIEKAY